MLGLRELATALLTPGKGIPAADESIATTSSRLEAVGVAPGADTRRDHRQLLLTAPGPDNQVFGSILCDETLGQAIERQASRA